MNTPYIYGGKNPLVGLDCSGLVECVLSAFGMDPPGVANAQAIYNYFHNKCSPQTTQQAGTLVFFGGSTYSINHVAILVNEFQMIEAGGGDQTTTTLEEAKRRGACVRLRLLSNRKDLVVALNPRYPTWVEESIL